MLYFLVGSITLLLITLLLFVAVYALFLLYHEAIIATFSLLLGYACVYYLGKIIVTGGFMSHWFLTARDIMWVFICFGPVLLSYGAGRESVLSDTHSVAEWLTAAILWQVLFVVCLYMGVIK